MVTVVIFRSTFDDIWWHISDQHHTRVSQLPLEINEFLQAKLRLKQDICIALCNEYTHL